MISLNHRRTPPDFVYLFLGQETSINPAGAITGSYVDANSFVHGFLRAPEGTITTVEVQGAVHTYPASINPAGAITGSYVDANGAHGFLQSR